MVSFVSPPTAVETNTRSPQTIGLDTATPGTGVFQRTLSPVVTFHFTAVGRPSATPDALGPRNDGHCWPDTAMPPATHRITLRTIGVARRMFYLPSTRV